MNGEAGSLGDPFRWRYRVGDDQVTQALRGEILLHARARTADPGPLCEIDGPPVDPRSGDVVLNLDQPGITPEHRAQVSCPGCIAWMRA